jgi:hypothetical protein
MERFIAWASGYRAPGHGIWELTGKVEEFLTWAMQWCKEAESKEETGTKATKDFVFAKTKSGYIIRGFGERGFVGDLIGFNYIFRLLQSPGKTVPIDELLSKSAKHCPGKADSEKQEVNENEKEGIRGSIQEALPTQDRKKLKEELVELSEARKEAERTENTEEYDRCEKKYEQIEKYLRTSRKRDGTPRDLNNQFSKKAPSIHTAKNRACEDLKKKDMPALAAHFLDCISESDGCGFKYHPSTPIIWSFDEPAP